MTRPRLAEWAALVDAEVPEDVVEAADGDPAEPPREGRFAGGDPDGDR